MGRSGAWLRNEVTAAVRPVRGDAYRLPSRVLYTSGRYWPGQSHRQAGFFEEVGQVVKVVFLFIQGGYLRRSPRFCNCSIRAAFAASAIV
jgi:hypothetical protein